MIKCFDPAPQLHAIEAEVMEAVSRVLHSGQLVLGPETIAFEEEFARLVGAKHCIGVTSGTTALHLALMCLDLGAGDEVITVANTCVPTVSAIELAGATPVFVDVNRQDLMIDPIKVAEAVTGRTKCILPVHLWGQGADMAELLVLGESLGIPVLEDCAQAQGAVINGKHAGTLGQAGTFSFYPTKNLGAYGDAGAIVTDDDALAERIRLSRMYGYTKSNYAKISGMNARIAEMQAAILRVKLPHLSGWINRRRDIASAYMASVEHSSIQLPHTHPERNHAFHQFVIQCEDRDAVIESLEKHSVQYGIHYPTPIHMMPPYSHFCPAPLPVTEQSAQRILSIPVHESLTDAEIDVVVTALNGV